MIEETLRRFVDANAGVVFVATSYGNTATQRSHRHMGFFRCAGPWFG